MAPHPHDLVQVPSFQGQINPQLVKFAPQIQYNPTPLPAKSENESKFPLPEGFKTMIKPIQVIN